MAVINPYNYAKPKNFMRAANEPAIVFPDTKNNNKSGNKTNDKLDQYLENRVLSAKPEELTYMLYEGLVKFIKKAMFALDEKNYGRVNYNSQRAQAILDELRSTLNMDVPLSRNLDDLYEYMGHKLLLANIEKNKDYFSETLDMAENFKETWKTTFNIR